MKKIAYLKFDYLPLSEVFVYEQIKNIKKFKVTIICAKMENLDKFPFENIKSLSTLNLISYLFNTALLKFNMSCPYFTKIIKEENISLIHAPFGWNGLLALPYKDKFNIPLVVNFYGHDVAIFKHEKDSNARIKQLLEKGDLFLAEGEFMKRELIKIGCPEEKVLVQHLGVDLEKFKFKERKQPENDEKIRILLIARFVEKKGIQYLIRAFANIRNKYTNVELKLVGDGPMKKSIKELIENLGISSDVTLTGFKPYNEISNELLEAHIFVHPSVEAKDGDNEGGAPSILFAAQATGLPVISTYHADIPEVVLNGKSGLLTNEKDVADLTEKINYLLERPDLWPKLGREGRKHIEKNYNIITQVEKLECIYKKFI
jgi:colanic acid/amylovoran biosynthesis glycosyltransferase